MRKWPNMLRRFFWISAASLLAGCGGGGEPAPESAARGEDRACAFEHVRFEADFPGARLNGCRQDGPGAYTLFIRPEDTPINPSPWYAFEVVSEGAATLDLTLSYHGGRHRYAPKISRDGGASWALLETDMEVSEDGRSARFPVNLEQGGALIAAQPVRSAASVEAWMGELAASGVFERRELGVSELGRPIIALDTANGGASEVLLIIGGQHPPETTGFDALEAFLERLAEDDPAARAFRGDWRIVAIPLLNPDGADLGQWRHNARGVDLNRDWGPFTQAETRLARAEFERASGGEPERVGLVLDFHSTWSNVLYTQPDNAAGRRADFAADWIAALDARLGDGVMHRDASHNPNLPTAKTWAHRTYGAPAITFEIADVTPPDEARRTGRLAAEEAMRLLGPSPE